MNRTTTIVLVVLFAALGLYVLAVQVPRDRAAAEAVEGVFVAEVTEDEAADQAAGAAEEDFCFDQAGRSPRLTGLDIPLA